MPFIIRSSDQKSWVKSRNDSLYPYLAYLEIPLLGWWIMWNWELPENRGFWYRLAELVAGRELR